jgi:phage terminase large subunit-like protein
MTDSLASRLADLSPEDRKQALAELTDEEAAALLNDWGFWARPEQLWPEGDHSTLWIGGGRGSGKTLSAAQIAASWVREFPDVNGGIVAPKFQAHARAVCIEGESGILRILGGEGGPYVKTYNRGEGMLYLRSGAVIYSAGTKDGAFDIQSKNLGWLWMDEPGLMPRVGGMRAWEESIRYAVRMPPARIVCSGTPKAGHPLVKLLEADPSVVKTRLRTIDNVDNLDPDWARRIMAKFQGTRLGRQELEGELVGEVEGALWLWVWIERGRMQEKPLCLRVVVGVDPSGGANEIGNVAAGLIKSPCPCGRQNELGPHYAVLDDRSLLASPERWGRSVVDLYHDLECDRVAAERNFGGAMVESTIRVADPTVPVKLVNASRGKAQRAEPVSAVYEQNRVHHVGTFAELETELTTWVPGDDWSPNRLDALVWALTELMEGSGGPATATVASGHISDW